jgi:hypothetical protein
MKLAKMLATHDDATLEALASKGLVRRAQRELAEGGVAVAEQTDAGATVTVDGQTVQIDARGLAASRCTCPAGGICRHIVVAVMLLRNATAPSGAAAPAEDGHTAAAEICKMTQAALVKFAASDWSAAVALARESKDASIVTSGRNCTVELAPVTVTFLAGQPLGKAAYKGPKTRARLVKTAAAIIVRAKNGVAVDAAASDGAAADAEAPPIAADFLDGARDVLLRAGRIVLGGSSPLAADMLFDLAISARAEGAPRLTSHLRRLARQGALAVQRDVSFEPQTFLVQTARTLALMEALRADPANDALTGSLRRDYRDTEPLDVWLLGASRWKSETGARGVTMYVFAPEARRWHSVTIARGAGQDPTFDPALAYELPLWGAGQPRTLMGGVLRLPAPLVAHDGSIAIALPKAAQSTGRVDGLRALLEGGAVHTAWDELRADLGQRFDGGMKRRAMPAPVLLAPARFGSFAFDELAQVYEWEAVDRAGDAIVFTLPVESDDFAQRLRRESRQTKVLLAEASVGDEGLVLRPCAIVGERGGVLDIVNLDLDHWRPPTALRAAVENVREALVKPAAPIAARDPLRDLAGRALDAATTAASGGLVPELASLTDSCEAAGLLTLTAALRGVAETPAIENALRVAYIAAEVRVAATWI